jgi:hypothetical protein
MPSEFRMICPTDKSGISLSSPVCKNIQLLDLAKSNLETPPSCSKRGAFRDRHGRWAWDAMDAEVLVTNGTAADGEVVWF